MNEGDIDPFRRAREERGAVSIEVDGERLVMLLRYGDVKRATHDWDTFTSDAPFRVPIPAESDVRRVRQLPIETDPPLHRAYRRVVREPFGRRNAEQLRPAIGDVLDGMLDDATAAGSLEVVRDFALPLQSRALALLLGRSIEDAEVWASWGLHVFRGSGGSHAGDLDVYLDAVLDEAERDPGEDYFGLLASATVDGRRLTRDEMLGFASLAFAGGRDTFITLVVNALHHLAEHPGALEQLRQYPELVESATEEFLRYFSPLSHIGRVATRDTEARGCPVTADSRISLAYASANHDSEVFDRPGECILDRRDNRHLAFGHGPHVCLGAPLTRVAMTALLGRLARRIGKMTVVEEEPMVKAIGSYRRRVGYQRLVLAVEEYR